MSKKTKTPARTHAQRFTTRLGIIIAVIAVIVAVIPVSLAANEAAKNAGTPESKVGTVAVRLELGNGYITYGSQTVSSPSSEIIVPEGKDLTFTAAADNGFKLDAVNMIKGGSPHKLSGGGTYTIAGKNVKKGLAIQLKTSEIPTQITEQFEDIIDTAPQSEQAGVIEPGEGLEPADEAVDVEVTEVEATVTEDAANGDEQVIVEEEVVDEQVEGAEPEEAEEAEDAEEPEEEQEAVPTKRVYTFEDSMIAATARLQKADAVPDNAEFKVTRVTPVTGGYNYNAYMDALNSSHKAESENLTYSDENTLLYDVAFIVDGKEYEPESGSVTIDITFKKAQLSQDIDVTAQDASQVEVTHLPLKGNKVEAAGTTKAATNISASDISVQPVPSNDKIVTANAGNQSAEVKLDSLSVLAFTNVLAAAQQQDASEVPTLMVGLGFEDAEGNAVEPAALDGTYLYALVSDSSNNRALYKLERKTGFYAAEVTGLYGQNGETNNGGYRVSIVPDQTYTVSLIAAKDGNLSQNSKPDQNDVTYLKNGSILAEQYTVELPASSDATVAAPYAAIAKPLPTIDISLCFETFEGAAVTPVPDLGNTYLYAKVSKTSDSGEYAYYRLAKNDDSSAYVAKVGNLLKSDNSKAALVSGEGYSVTVYQSAAYTEASPTRNPNNPDTFGELEKGIVLANDYTLTTVAAGTVKPGEFCGMVATGFGPAGSDTFTSVLGSCIDFGITTGTFTQNGGDAETNVAAKVAVCTTQTGNDITNNAEQTFILGEVTNKFVIKGFPAFVRVPSDYADNVSGTGGTVVTKDTTHSESQLKAEVQALLNYGKASSAMLVTRAQNAAPVYTSSQKYVVDITNRGPGTYYVTLDAATYAKVMSENDKLQIKMNNATQTIVFNVTAGGAIDMRQFVVNGTSSASYLGGEDANGNALGKENPTITNSIIWNFANATNVNFAGSATGVFLAPNASVTTGATCSGWLVCNSVTIGAGEWHNVRPNVVVLSDKASFFARKAIGNVEDDATVNGFTFTLEELDANGQPVNSWTASNNGASIGFEPIQYGEQGFAPDVEGGNVQTHTYRLKETQGTTDADGNLYAKDSTVYYAQVKVTKSTTSSGNTSTTRYVVTGPVYYVDPACTSVLDDVPTFVNTVTSDASGQATISARKTLSTNAMVAVGAYEFQLLDSTGTAVRTVANGASGVVSFEPLTYTAAYVMENGTQNLSGDWTLSESYRIHESSTAADGWKNAADVPVTVTASYAQGADFVTVTVTYGTGEAASANPPEMVNTYYAKATFDLKGTKTIEHRNFHGAGDGVEADSVTFEVSAAAGVPLPSIKRLTIKPENGNSADINFGEIKYGLNDLGGLKSKDFTYTITETACNNGMLGASATQTVIVTVTDEGNGTLSTSVNYLNENRQTSFEFDNGYNAEGTITFRGTKTLEQGEGVAENNAGQFTYEIVEASIDEDGNWQAVVNEDDQPYVVAIGRTRADGSISFGQIKYGITQVGTHHYLIREVIPSGSTPYGDASDNRWLAGNYIYDGTNWRVTVEVADKGDGTLTVSSDHATTADADDANKPTISFVNEHTQTASVVLTATKDLVGAPLGKGKFTFLLENAAGEKLQEKANGNGAESPVGLVTFDAISYTSADAGKTFTYYISEKLPSGVSDTNKTSQGMTYDTKTVSVTVSVRTNEEGKLVAGPPTYTSGTSSTFTNRYDASGSLDFGGSKSVLDLSGHAAASQAGKLAGYKFTVNEYRGMRDATSLAGRTWTMTTDADGNFGPLTLSDGTTVDKVTYGLDHLNKNEAGEYEKTTYTYEIVETDPQRGGITPGMEGGAIKKFRLSVELEDEGNGNIKVTRTGQNPENIQATNTYDATGKLTLAGSKTTSDFDGARTFGYTVYEGANVVATGSSDANGLITFTGIDYSLTGVEGTYPPGTHTYTVRENVPEGVEAVNGQYTYKGVTYDTTDRVVTVEVTDDGEGKLNASIASDSQQDGIAFTNAYSAQGEASFTVRKTLSGRDFASNAGFLNIFGRNVDEFTFKVEGLNGAPMPQGADTVTISGVDFPDKNVGIASFGPIRYGMGDRGKTYYYQVTEQIPQGASENEDGSYSLGGITYSQESYMVAVEVANASDGEGNIPTTVYLVNPGNADDKANVNPVLNFTNAYEAAGSIALAGTKTLTGRSLAASEFGFTVSEMTGEGATIVKTVGNLAGVSSEDGSFAGAINFGSIEYSLEDLGEHTYMVSENMPVDENGDPLEGAVQNKDGSYTYNGVTYSNAGYQFTVTVADNGDGTLKVTSSGDSVTALDFTNAYEASGSVSIPGSKSISTRGFVDGDSFTFTIAADTAGAPMPGVTTVTVAPSKANDYAAGFAFGPINYTQANAGRSYVYRVSETAGPANIGISYDTFKLVTVSVTDTGDGTLEATVTSVTDAEGNELVNESGTPLLSAAFVNGYDAVGSFAFRGTKTLDSRDFRADDSITFTLTGPKIDGSIENVVTGVTDGRVASVDFGTLNFELADLGGKRSEDFAYTITEQATMAGVSGAVQPQTVTLTVTDNGRGTLDVTSAPALDGDGNSFAFVNLYEARGSVTFAGTKTYDNRAVNAHDVNALSFTLIERVTGENNQVTDKVIDNNIRIDGSGNILFPAISYTQGDIGTHTYVLHENVPAPEADRAVEDKGNGVYVYDGVTYDTRAVRTITVTVEDTADVDSEGHGVLSTTVTYDDGTATAPGAANFVNAYAAVGDLSFAGTKTLQGRPMRATDDFRFVIEEQQFDGDGQAIQDAAGNFVYTQLGDSFGVNADGSIQFPTLTYDIATPGDLGNHVYRVRELPANVASADAGYTMTTDDRSYTVAVEVFDTGLGTLDVRQLASSNDPQSLDFTNIYTARTSVQFAGTKSMLGRDLTAGVDGYVFTVEEHLLGPDNLPGGVIRTFEGVQEGANAAIRFPVIEYTEGDVGKTFVYVVKEGESGLDGVSTDDGVYEVIVTVEYDEATGGISATMSNNATALDFTNNWTGKTEAALDPVKTITYGNTGEQLSLEGEDLFLENAHFLFELRDSNGDVIESVVNSGSKIHFKELEFDRPGTYIYTIHEIAPVDEDGNRLDLPYMTLDAEVITATVNVTLQDDGKLDASVSYDKVPVEKQFDNTYTSQEASAEVFVAKLLSGREIWGDADRFDFTLVAGTATKLDGTSPLLDGTGAAVAVPMPADATVRVTSPEPVGFGTMSYLRPGIYSYTVTEALPFDPANPPADARQNEEDGTWTYNGITYDTAPRGVRVTVTDNGAGQLEANVDYGIAGATAANVTNTYRVEGDTQATLGASKSLRGAALADGQFAFTLTETTDGVESPLSYTAWCRADGSVSFTPIVYDEPGTYTYEVSEKMTDATGVSYDGTVYTATVEVFDNGVGGLGRTITYNAPNGDVVDVPIFTNDYFLANWSLAMTKRYFGQNPQAFGFTLTATDANFVPRPGQVESYDANDVALGGVIVDDGEGALVVNAANGAFADTVAQVVFPQVSYVKPGTYYYVAAEQPFDGVITDAAEYLVTVVVDDAMNATASYQMRYMGEVVDIYDDADLVFYNNDELTLGFKALSALGYSAGDASTNVYPTVYKAVDGTSAGLSAGAYTFGLYDETGGLMRLGTNDSNGEVSFYGQGSFGLTFTPEDAGTHRYTIRELASGSVPGMTYDSRVVGMTVEVSTNADGMLEATTTYQMDGAATDRPTFDNVTEGMNLRLQKVSRMGGEGLADCTYGLWMVNPGGYDVLLAEAVTDSDGWMTFENVHLQLGNLYYFKEVKAPSGHKVDPYRSVYLTPVYDEATGALSLEVAESTKDNLHPNEG